MTNESRTTSSVNKTLILTRVACARDQGTTAINSTIVKPVVQSTSHVHAQDASQTSTITKQVNVRPIERAAPTFLFEGGLMTGAGPDN